MKNDEKTNENDEKSNEKGHEPSHESVIRAIEQLLEVQFAAVGSREDFMGQGVSKPKGKMASKAPAALSASFSDRAAWRTRCRECRCYAQTWIHQVI